MPDPARTYQHYEVLRRGDGAPWELGRGAMGITYKAFDVNLRCEVALKVVNSALLDHPEARDRFVREARAAAALRHRNVASVYHLGNDGEHFFYAMEFIDGETLDALVRRQGPMSPRATLRIILQVTRALMAAARQGLVHRDIKPTNLMVIHEDADDHMVVKVIDFGLARPVASEEAGAQLTISGFLGTPQYASPEQLEEKPLDARSDIYSLGVTAWFLLTGRVPFSGSLATVCQQQLTKPPPWDLLPAALPAPVRRLLAHMLAKEPEHRPQDAAELRRVIEACLQATRSTEEDDENWSDDHRRPDAARAAATPPTPPSEGTLLGGQYELVTLVAEEQGTRVYHARDVRSERRSVAVRTFAPELTDTPEKRAQIEAEVRAIQAAAHPGLVRLFSLKQPPRPQPVFVVEEWLDGFSLRDLLAAHGGRLPAEDVLRLLENAAPTTDHAAARGLPQLGLGSHQVGIHFPSTQLGLGGASTARALLPVALDQWPSDWIVKIHPLIVSRDAGELDTWSGDVTLLPGSRPAKGGDASLTVQHRRALASLVCELLGGDPTRVDKFGGRQENQSLPALNEIANRVLAQAMSDADVLGTSQEFCSELKIALGTETIHRPRPRTEALPAALPFRVDVEKPVAPSASSMPRVVTGKRRASTRPLEAETRSESFAAPHDSRDIAGFTETDGSAWERMTLVAGKPSSAGRWFVALMTIAVVFVAAFVGVFVALWYHGPARDARTGRTEKSSRFTLPVTTSAGHPATPAPPRINDLSPPTAAHAWPTPAPVASVGDDHRRVAEPTPLPSATVAASAPPAERPSPAARSVAVKLESIPKHAEIRLRGKSLGFTPLEVNLPPGDYQLVARFRDWPETRENLHVNADQSQAFAEIHIMPPGLVPLRQESPASQFLKTRRETPPPEKRNVVRPAAISTPIRVLPTPTATPQPTATEPEVRRALPVENSSRPILTPFITPEPGGASMDRATPDEEGSGAKPASTPDGDNG